MMHKNSFIVFVALTTYSFHDTNAAIEPIGTKYVLTKFEDLPNFYEKLRSQNSGTKSKSKLTDSITRGLCTLIFGQDAVIEPDIPMNMEILEHDYPKIFGELFNKNEGKSNLFGMKRSRSKRYSYDNSPKPRTFLVNAVKREEKTFACVTQDSDRTKIDMFYVSEYDYDVNEGDHNDKEKLFGRFIFLGERIYALAEKLPQMVLLKYFEKKEYVEKRNRYKSAEKWEDDPVCKLDSGRKIRLCTYVCAQVYTGCEDKVAIEESCIRMNYRNMWMNTFYDEWVLNCIIKHPPVIGNEVREEKFLIARTHISHEVFAFKESQFSDLRIGYHLRGVAFVIDEHHDGEKNYDKS